ATAVPWLSWYRQNYYLYFMSGASAVYLEQGFDQFFKPGPGEHPFQLNPLGRITDESIRVAQKHADRGTPYTPVAFLLDPAHGWDMTDWPQFPLGVAHIDRSDRALRELFLAAYYPAAQDEGEPATADRQAFINAAFGDIFDVLVANDKNADAVDAYHALVVGGRVEWTPAWGERLKAYVQKGGTVVLVGRGRVVVCAVPDLLGLDERLVPAAAHMLAHLFADATPVRVRGDIEHLVNRNERGWVVTLINNRGVYKPQQGLARVERG